MAGLAVRETVTLAGQAERARVARAFVTVIIEDTCYRILHGEEELAVKPRKDTSPITRLYVRGMKTQA